METKQDTEVSSNKEKCKTEKHKKSTLSNVSVYVCLYSISFTLGGGIAEDLKDFSVGCQFGRMISSRELYKQHLWVQAIRLLQTGTALVSYIYNLLHLNFFYYGNSSTLAWRPFQLISSSR